MVAKDRLVDDIDGDGAGRLDFADAGWWPEMIANAIGSAEAARGDDFLVKNALASKAWKMAMSHVSLTRDRADLSVRRHGSAPERGRG